MDQSMRNTILTIAGSIVAAFLLAQITPVLGLVMVAASLLVLGFMVTVASALGFVLYGSFGDRKLWLLHALQDVELKVLWPYWLGILLHVIIVISIL